MVFPAVNFPGTSRQAAHRDFITFKDSLSDTAVLLKELHEMKVPAVGKGMVSHIGKASGQLCLGKVKQPFKGMGPYGFKSLVCLYLVHCRFLETGLPDFFDISFQVKIADGRFDEGAAVQLPIGSCSFSLFRNVDDFRKAIIVFLQEL